MLNMQDLDLQNKRVLIRVDFNVPIQDGKIQNQTRIDASLATIKQAINSGAKIILISHLGRPKAKVDMQYSLAPVAKYLETILPCRIKLVNDWQQDLIFQENEIILLENIRFYTGETNNDTEVAKKLASLGDVFVMDAFATAHRKHASTYGVANYIPQTCLGLLMQQELKVLKQIFQQAKLPLLAIVGGAKISTKLTMLYNLLNKVQYLIVGGGIANTFLLAQGEKIGASLAEPELIDEAKRVLQKAKQNNVQIGLPLDVIVGKHIDQAGNLKSLHEIAPDEAIYDIGPTTVEQYSNMINQSNTILFNGPVGVFESKYYRAGSESICKALASADAYIAAGGGDTVSLIGMLKISNKIDYISTGGGAFLYYMEHETLPILQLLQHKVF